MLWSYHLSLSFFRPDCNFFFFTTSLTKLCLIWFTQTWPMYFSLYSISCCLFYFNISSSDFERNASYIRMVGKVLNHSCGGANSNSVPHPSLRQSLFFQLGGPALDCVLSDSGGEGLISVFLIEREPCPVW